MTGKTMWCAARGGGDARMTRRAAAGLLLLLVSGCGGSTVPLGVRGYRHGDAGEPVREFRVDGVAGVPVPAGGEPGKAACCVNLPFEWTPGLTAKVEVDDGPSHQPARRIVAVPVEEYRGPAHGTLQAHFYPDGRVRLVVSRFSPGHPRYPLVEGVALDWGVYRNYCALRPSEGVCQLLPKGTAP